MQNETAQQVSKALKEANNVLVTVKNSPSVDELAAAVGLTLLLNHMGKHAITVFSGRVPSTIEFLQPENAIDTNTDSLRDFIIALDKAKADKLRYKVEDNVVRIFITPYKTSISEKDLQFSQGDFNVDVVVALGVVSRENFDQAITTQGGILHNATVVTVTKQGTASQLGAINWQEAQASSISEMIAGLVDTLGPNLLDGQIATAFMTGIVAETDRFKNASTTPQVLAVSSKLMAAGANQQLIAEKLDEPDLANVAAPIERKSDGALEIAHEEGVKKIEIDDHGNLQAPPDQPLPPVAEDQTASGADATLQSSSPAGRGYISPATPPRLYAQDDSGTEAPHNLLDEQPAHGLHTDVTTHPATDLNPPSQDSNGRKVLHPIPDDDEVASAPQPSFHDGPPLTAASSLPLEPSTGLPDLSQQDKKSEEPAVPETPVEPTPPAPPASPVEPPQLPPAEPAAASQVPSSASEFPDTTNQTLTELEEAVDSPHVHVNNQEPASNESTSVDDFLGTSRPIPPPVAEEPPVPPAEPEASPEPPILPEAPAAPLEPTVPPEPAPSVELPSEPGVTEEAPLPEEKKVEEPPPGPPPQVMSPTAPPPGPPPLMPQSPNQPQFFDADGNNTNPFLNPS